ncbi:SCO6745 family protein [Pseudonocardia sp. CA-107938]|uniref:SCO6745 family protein n=1 Tax=Pseudonocardia sp. CA-107938 TaxID=3240021 RepID=UPI003D916D1B
MTPTPTLARRLWEAVEPLHAIVYFAPQPAAAARRIGLRGYWMGYFASRVAPLGPVPPVAVAAMAYGFAPSMVARAIPDAWSYAEPALVLETRIAAAAEALRAAFDPAEVTALAELAEPLWETVAACRFDGRPLAAAWSQVPRPADPVASAWLAAGVLREHRGDGHVLAAVAHGLAGLDATLTFVAAGGMQRDVIQPARGWTDEEWAQSARRLAARGLLDRDGRLTRLGGALRHDVEDMTDRLAAAPVERLGPTGVEDVIARAAPLSRVLVDTGAFPVPNPVGAPRP